jgi:hypothetical protein
MGMSVPEITFKASLFPGKTGYQRSADGVTIRLDIPETEMPNAVPLMALHRVLLEVTIRVVRENPMTAQEELETP